MQEEEPKFSSYTYEELLSARENIDRVKFPDRFAKIEKLLSARAGQESLEKGVSNEKLVLCGFLTAEMILWLVVILASLLGYSFF